MGSMSDSIDPELDKFQTWFRLDREHSKKWRDAAKEDFDFRDGEQWSEEDKRVLKAQMRPVVTFNRTHPIINSISGMEINNRQEVKYFPREVGDAHANEILTEGAKWFRDQANADDEDSDAFLDAATCGMGWTETVLDFEEDEAGAPRMYAKNPLDMYWDHAARAKNLSDARRIWEVKEIPESVALEMFDDKDPSELDAGWAKGTTSQQPIDSDPQNRYTGEGEERTKPTDKMVTIVHLQYKDKETRYDVADRMTGQVSEVTKEQLAKIQARAEIAGIPLAVAKKTVSIVRNVFIGASVLHNGKALCDKHFSLKCVTAYKEHSTGTFYGLMRMMKDPQRWANKWMSQALHILNSNAKGGLMMEEDAVEDVRDFEKNWARPDKVALLKPGAIAGQKIKEKPQAQMPASFYQMMEFAIQSVRDVTGVSVELLGMREANQAASLENQRKQAGMNILAPLYDNLKRYRRDHGKLMLAIIQKYLNDGRLVRIVGEDGAKYVPLALEADAQFDVIVDDQPNSPDHKMQIWTTLAPYLQNLPPQIQVALLDYSPFPPSVVEKVREAIKGMSQPDPQAEQRSQIELEGLQAEVAKTKSEVAKNIADAQSKGQGNGHEAHQLAKIATDAQVKREGMAINADISREKMEQDALLQLIKTMASPSQAARA